MYQQQSSAQNRSDLLKVQAAELAHHQSQQQIHLANSSSHKIFQFSRWGRRKVYKFGGSASSNPMPFKREGFPSIPSKGELVASPPAPPPCGSDGLVQGSTNEGSFLLRSVNLERIFQCLQFSQKTNLKMLIFAIAYWGRNFSFVFWEN